MMKISLKGRKALVGGSTSGLGRAIALQLAACGAEVTLMARNEEKMEGLLKELPADAGQQHGFLMVDFMDFSGLQEKLSNFFAGHSVDIVVNNTNGPSSGRVTEKSTADYQQAFDLLFKSYCLTGMSALEGMKNNRFGRIINVSSMSVKEPMQNLVLSNTIRSAVISWAKTLATEVAPFGITVNNMLTGSFDTERLRDLHRQQAEDKGVPLEEWRKQMADGIPLRRFGKPEEYGYLAAFLASEYASYITGTNIPIDGGALKSI